MKIAIQGAESSFHALAAKELFGTSVELVYCKNFVDVFNKVADSQAEGGVVAIENSLYGSINETYDLLVRYRLHITGEVYQHIGLHLLGTKDSALNEISKVFSQAPALAEAEDYLNSNLPNAERHEYEDTARAAEMVSASKNNSYAAIASRAAAKQYGLKVLATNIETHHHNYTRFIALGTHPAVAGFPKAKSSIIFETADTPGSLYAVLGVFAQHNINLTKLESRPIVGKAWRYMYYIDFELNCESWLLNELHNHTNNLRVLGVYENKTHIP